MASSGGLRTQSEGSGKFGLDQLKSGLKNFARTVGLPLQGIRKPKQVLLEDEETVLLQIGRSVWHVSRTLRVELWLSTLVQAGPHIMAQVQSYDDYLSKGIVQEASNDIEKDITRTYPNTKRFAEADGQNSLRNVLRAYAAYDPEVGYCQGMNFITGLLLMFMPSEAHAFAGLVLLMEDRGLRKYYHRSLSLLQVQLWQLGKLISTKLNTHLEATGVVPMLYAAPWLMTAFSADFPIAFSCRIMDTLLVGMECALLKVAMTIMRKCERKLRSMHDLEDILSYLKIEVPGWEEHALHDLLTEAFSRDWSPRHRAILGSTEGAETVAQAMDRVMAMNSASDGMTAQGDDDGEGGDELDEQPASVGMFTLPPPPSASTCVGSGAMPSNSNTDAGTEGADDVEGSGEQQQPQQQGEETAAVAQQPAAVGADSRQDQQQQPAAASAVPSLGLAASDRTESGTVRTPRTPRGSVAMPIPSPSSQPWLMPGVHQPVTASRVLQNFQLAHPSQKAIHVPSTLFTTASGESNASNLGGPSGQPSQTLNDEDWGEFAAPALAARHSRQLSRSLPGGPPSVFNSLDDCRGILSSALLNSSRQGSQDLGLSIVQALQGAASSRRTTQKQPSLCRVPEDPLATSSMSAAYDGGSTGVLESRQDSIANAPDFSAQSLQQPSLLSQQQRQQAKEQQQRRVSDDVSVDEQSALLSMRSPRTALMQQEAINELFSSTPRTGAAPAAGGPALVSSTPRGMSIPSASAANPLRASMPVVDLMNSPQKAGAEPGAAAVVVVAPGPDGDVPDLLKLSPPLAMAPSRASDIPQPQSPTLVAAESSVVSVVSIEAAVSLTEPSAVSLTSIVPSQDSSSVCVVADSVSSLIAPLGVVSAAGAALSSAAAAAIPKLAPPPPAPVAAPITEAPKYPQHDTNTDIACDLLRTLCQVDSGNAMAGYNPGQKLSEAMYADSPSKEARSLCRDTSMNASAANTPAPGERDEDGEGDGEEAKQVADAGDEGAGAAGAADAEKAVHRRKRSGFNPVFPPIDSMASDSGAEDGAGGAASCGTSLYESLNAVAGDEPATGDDAGEAGAGDGSEGGAGPSDKFVLKKPTLYVDGIPMFDPKTVMGQEAPQVMFSPMVAPSEPNIFKDAGGAGAAPSSAPEAAAGSKAGETVPAASDQEQQQQTSCGGVSANAVDPFDELLASRSNGGGCAADGGPASTSTSAAGACGAGPNGPSMCGMLELRSSLPAQPSMSMPGTAPAPSAVSLAHAASTQSISSPGDFQPGGPDSNTNMRKPAITPGSSNLSKCSSVNNSPPEVEQPQGAAAAGGSSLSSSPTTSVPYVPSTVMASKAAVAAAALPALGLPSADSLKENAAMFSPSAAVGGGGPAKQPLSPSPLAAAVLQAQGRVPAQNAANAIIDAYLHGGPVSPLVNIKPPSSGGLDNMMGSSSSESSFQHINACAAPRATTLTLMQPPAGRPPLAPKAPLAIAVGSGGAASASAGVGMMASVFAQAQDGETGHYPPADVMACMLPPRTPTGELTPSSSRRFGGASSDGGTALLQPTRLASQELDEDIKAQIEGFDMLASRPVTTGGVVGNGGSVGGSNGATGTGSSAAAGAGSGRPPMRASFESVASGVPSGAACSSVNGGSNSSRVHSGVGTPEACASVSGVLPRGMSMQLDELDQMAAAAASENNSQAAQ